MDVHDKKTRSYNMSKIRSKNTKPEQTVAKYLYKSGFRYRLNVTELPGKPDIVLRKYKTAIFINGCFWHVHEGCKYFKWPATNEMFWRDKLSRNVQRDIQNYKKLEIMGWKVVVLWECDIKNADDYYFRQLVEKIIENMFE